MDVHVVKSNGGPYYPPRRVLVGVAKAQVSPSRTQAPRSIVINQPWTSGKVSHVSRMRSIFMNSSAKTTSDPDVQHHHHHLHSHYKRSSCLRPTQTQQRILTIHCQAADGSPPPPTPPPTLPDREMESSPPEQGRRTSLWSPIYRERLDEWRKLSKGSTCSDTSEDSLCSSSECSSLTRGSGSSVYDIHWSKGFSSSPKDNSMDNVFRTSGQHHGPGRPEDCGEVFSWSGAGSSSRGSTPLRQISRSSSPLRDQRRDSTSSVTSINSASVRDMIKLFDRSDEATSQSSTSPNSRVASRSNSITNVNFTPTYLCDRFQTEDHHYPQPHPPLQPKLSNGTYNHSNNITAHGHANKVQLRNETPPVSVSLQSHTAPAVRPKACLSNHEQKENNPHIINISHGNDSSINITVGTKSIPTSPPNPSKRPFITAHSGQQVEGHSLIDPNNVHTSRRVIYNSVSPKTGHKDGIPTPTQTGLCLHSRRTGPGQGPDGEGKPSHLQYRNQVFFRAGGLAQLEDARDEKITGTIIALQAYCRGYLGRQNLKKLKLQHMAVTCLQRNIKKFMAIREWPWWRLYTKVQPLLNVHRTEEELRDKEVELEQTKLKAEKLEKERNDYKQSVEKLETKLSEMTADYAEEHTTSNQATDLLEAEQSQRMRLEKELKEMQTKYTNLQRKHETTEMDLMQAQLIVASIDGELDDEDIDGDSIYRQKYERSRREMDMMKKKTEQHQEELEEQYTATKKQLDRKLTDAVTECDELRRQVGNLKRKTQRQLADMQDMKLHIEEQVARNAELEKKQRKFDAEMQKMNEALKTEKLQREKLQRERDQLATDKFTLEQQLKNVQMDCEIQSEKLGRMDRELNEMTTMSRDDKELMQLKRLKSELETKVTDQEEELDDQAGSIQQLEQAKLRLEMAQEKLRQQNSKELEEKDQELEEMRANTQKKLRALEVQVEEEYSERQNAMKEKRELERKLQALAEQEAPANRETEKRLRRDLKRTRALLADAQMMLDKAKDGQASRASIKQLRNQLEDAEYGMQVAIKARKGLELEVQELQSQADDVTKAKHEMEERLLAANREKTDLQSKLEENEEDMAEIMKKFKAAVQQQSVDHITLQDQSAQIETLTSERENLREQLSGLQYNLEYMQTSMIDKQQSARLEGKVRDLESRLELEQTSRHRSEVQAARLKDTIEQLTSEKDKVTETDQVNAEQVKKLQRQIRDLREELSDAQRKESEASQRKTALEQKIESMETDYEQSQSDLRLAFKRISDLQAVIEDGMDSEEDEDDSVGLTRRRRKLRHRHTLEKSVPGK